MAQAKTPNCGAARLSSLLALALLAGCLAETPPVFAEDIVTIATGRDGEGRSRLVGQISEYTGRELRIIRNGREDSVPAANIVRIQTTRSDFQKQADGRFADRAFEAALNLYREAVKEEKRVWMRREILAQTVRCYHGLGRIDAACESFALVYASDPDTIHIGAIPLSWRSQQMGPSLEQRAAAWINNEENAAARLMGASWSFSGAGRGRALSTLEDLTSDRDTRIAHLAAAQLWRAKVVTVDDATVGRWKAQIKRMPSAIQSGPHYVVGLALGRLGKSEAAAVALMRAPILYPDNHRLAAHSLLAAGRELEKMNRPAEARSLYREVLADYAAAGVAQEAKARLEKLAARKQP